jgi:hypothetical protein
VTIYRVQLEISPAISICEESRKNVLQFSQTRHLSAAIGRREIVSRSRIREGVA